MALSLLACPYCNAKFAFEAGLVRGGRVYCPRCGEPLPATPETSIQSGTPPLNPLETAIRAGQPLPASLPPVPRRSNWKLGLALLSGMVLIAGISLTFALLTQQQRRDNDFRAKSKPVAPRELQPPAELTGLGYLPQGTNVVAGLHLADLMTQPAGQKLLEEPRPAWLQSGLGNIEKWTALEARELDHVVLGLTLKNKLPQLAIVVQTLKPYDQAALRKALAPAQPVNHRGKPLYRFGLKPTGQGTLWCPNDRTMVLLLRLDAVKIEDMEAIPMQPRSKLEALTAEVRHILTQRVKQESLAWLVGRWDTNPALGLLFGFAGLDKESADQLANLQAVALNVYPQDGWTLLGYFQGPDDAANRTLEKLLRNKRVAKATSYTVLGPPPDPAPPDTNWVTLQARMDAASLRNLELKNKD